MIRERIKWLDPVTQVTILVFIGIIFFLLFFFFLKRMTTGIFMLSITSIGFLRGVWMINHDSGLIIENDYPGEFFIKPKNSDNPVEITPSTLLPIEADGIKINGKVFKLITGTNVKITKDGKIKSYSLFSALVNEYITLNKISIKEQIQWKKLFEVE